MRWPATDLGTAIGFACRIDQLAPLKAGSSAFPNVSRIILGDLDLAAGGGIGGFQLGMGEGRRRGQQHQQENFFHGSLQLQGRQRQHHPAGDKGNAAERGQIGKICDDSVSASR